MVSFLKDLWQVGQEYELKTKNVIMYYNVRKAGYEMNVSIIVIFLNANHQFIKKKVQGVFCEPIILLATLDGHIATYKGKGRSQSGFWVVEVLIELSSLRAIDMFVH